VEELGVLHQRAVATRIKVLMAQHNLGVADGFALFDTNHDGNLTAEEMYVGLKYIGLHMTPAELRDLIMLFDADGNGVISLDEFKTALTVPGLDDDLEREREEREKDETQPDLPPKLPKPLAPFPGTGGQGVAGDAAAVAGDEPPPYTPPASAANAGISIDQGVAVMPMIPAKTLENMFAKLTSAECKFTGLVEIWNSKGTSTGKASIWALDLSSQRGWGARVMGNRDERVVIGYYLAADYVKPKEAMTVEMKDHSVRRDSDWNNLIKPRLLPCPANFRQVCKLTRDGKQLVVWEPVPPNAHFVALRLPPSLLSLSLFLSLSLSEPVPPNPHFVALRLPSTIN